MTHATPLQALLLLLCGLVPLAPSLAQEPPTPEVVIRQQGNQVQEEYRVGGRLYMIRIIPQKGVPYYLIDSDGDGDMDSRRDELTDTTRIPSWILLSW